MSNREKVLTWLEICGKDNNCSRCCPYSKDIFGECDKCRESLMADAYDLLKEQEEQIKNCDESLEKAQKEIKRLRGILKEQEAVKPICKILFDIPYYFCGQCNEMLNMYSTKAMFCSKCGHSVKWGTVKELIKENHCFL